MLGAPGSAALSSISCIKEGEGEGEGEGRGREGEGVGGGDSRKWVLSTSGLLCPYVHTVHQFPIFIILTFHISDHTICCMYIFL
jgi:hypothetical protein